MSKISIIIPVYNVEKYLRECLDSIINQTFKDLEIILIDDGGKDLCPQILDEYAQKDRRICVIHKQNGGYGQTCNVGLEHATGEYVAIVEPDDYIEPRMYEDLYNIAKKFNSDVVKSGFYNNFQTKQLTKVTKDKWNNNLPENTSFTLKEYPDFLSYHPSIWTCIYKREFLNKHNIRFTEAPGAGWTDNPFQVQTMCLAQRINYTSNAYYYWRRLNYFASDDLKDYTLPFIRSEEIHQWLEKSGINDEGILYNLHKREMEYIKIVLGMNKISDKEDCYDKISSLCANITGPSVSKKDQKFLAKVKKHPELVRFNLQLKRLLKSLRFINLNTNSYMNLYSICNTYTHTVYTLFGIKFKFKLKFIKRTFNHKYNINGENNKIIILENGKERFLRPNEIINDINISINGNNNIIKIFSKDCKRVNIDLHSSNSLIFIGKGCWVHGLSVFTMNGNNQVLEWGDGSSTCGTEIHLTEEDCQVIIGKDCQFSSQIQIWPTDGHVILDRESGKILNSPTKITIGNHCWIALGAHFTKNANIANNTIVGARSVVTKKFTEEYTAIAGNPAKVVSRNVKWERETSTSLRKNRYCTE